MATLFAGTSGFAYPLWKPDFYPPKLPTKDFLKHYATRLNAVEINYTFRQLPKTTTLENWIAATPEGFTFVCKAHQRITHILRLRESEFTDVFFKAIDPLRTSRRLGPVLFQLAPNLKADLPLLTAFVEKLPRDIRCAFEFRNKSWLIDEVYRLFEKHGIGLCLAESDKFEVPEVVTAGFVYVRLRKEDYSTEERAEVAERVRGMLAGGRDVYVFFKHEDTPAGAVYAEELLKAAG
ncbi:MAG TPA: DUF72 domain-containing protein [Bryobacteraceae bacterium]|jgi:uncharacterized protein YecE (DUF72 family)|nr:DUF72 domain-containing protein [Bryobacteraceae bacterium]